ncbi:MAG: hypothetical protein J6R90_07285 [Alistipes sp.]|nr:hypothetical protein [Alistipes sp.]
MRSIIRHILLLAVVAIAMACNTTPRTVEVIDHEGSVWSSAEEIYYTNQDSLLKRDIKIVVRYDRTYKADSIALRVLTVAPDSMVLEEPFVLRVPRLNDLRPEEQTFVYRSNVVLKHKGDYLFRLTPETAVEGIASVGLIIEE